MKTTVCVFLFLVSALVLSASAAADDLELLKSQYEGRVAAVRTAGLPERQALAARYTNSLYALQVRAQQAGDLDLANFIRTERDRFASEQTAPAPTGRTPELKSLFGAMIQNMRMVDVKEANAVLKLSSTYDASLGELQKSLTQAGKIDDALAVQAERKALAASGDLATARGMTGVQAQTAVATSPGVVSSGGRIDPAKLAERLVNTKWSFPYKSEDAWMKFLKNGVVERSWEGRPEYTWKVLHDGATQLRASGHEETIYFFIVFDPSLSEGVTADIEGRGFRMMNFKGKATAPASSGLLQIPAPPQKIEASKQTVFATWEPSQMTKEREWHPLEWKIPFDVASQMEGVKFSFTKGNDRLEMRNVVLLADGHEVARDNHFGIAGRPSKGNSYAVKLPPSVRASARVVLQVSVLSGGTDSRGNVAALTK